MPRHLLIDQVHLDFFVPVNLSDSEQRAIRRTFSGPAFRSRLYRAARSVVRRYPSLIHCGHAVVLTNPN